MTEIRTQHKLFNDHFQNYKVYNLHKAQLIIADVPYNVGKNAYGSNPMWYVNGDNKNGQSELAGKEFFDTDKNFKPAEFMHFCSKMLKNEPKERGKAPAMLLFCEFEDQFYYIELAKRYGLNNYINIVFYKNYSPQVLKANMRIVGNSEYALLFYRDKLLKFNNNGQMIFNCMEWIRDNESPKIHPTQKPVKLLERLIKLFTDEGEIVIDPVCGSGSSIIAAMNINRSGYGFEIKKDFYKQASDWVNDRKIEIKEIKEFGWAKSAAAKEHPILEFK